MSDEQRGLKDRKLQKHYEDLLAMYASPGWEQFEAALKELFDAADTLEGVNTEGDLKFRRGQMDILHKLLAQPAVTKAAYEALLESDDES